MRVIIIALIAILQSARSAWGGSEAPAPMGGGTGAARLRRAGANIFVICCILAFPAPAFADIDYELHGYSEVRAGTRLQNDPDEKNASVMEARTQLEALLFEDMFDAKYKADIWGDGISGNAEYDTREAWIFTRPAEFLDIKAGRQVLTWGTGDLVFLNDLFPKDWQSYFIGRDSEYLKAPSDAVKTGIFTGFANIDFVYTPQFDPDRYITGKYISFGQFGQNELFSGNAPDKWFNDDEIALRLYKNIKGYELAFYGYSGYWKTPSTSGVFNRLNVYGSSVRGQLGRGIGNAEFAYYDSRDDKSGDNAAVKNSQARYLIGYAQEIGKDFNASIQYYAEQMLDYDAYKRSVTGASKKDRMRQVATLQLTKLLMNQNLEISLSGYCSPNEEDAYLRPRIQYKYSDRITLETGANLFAGEHNNTHFGQYKDNNNLYMSMRYSF